MKIFCGSKDSRGIPTSTGLNINSYNDDGTIGPLENGANGMVPKLILGGYTESVSSMPELGKYTISTVPCNDHAHAFNYWKTSPTVPLGVRDEVIAWLLAGPAEGWGNTGGGGGTTDNNLIGYRLWVTGGDGTTPVLGPDDVSATITDLEPNTDYIGHLVAYNAFGDSPEATYAFRSNPDPAVAQKDQPRGIIALLQSANGFWGDVTGEAFWDFAYVDGCRARTGWAQLEPTEGDYRWDLLNADIDALLAFCLANGKTLGLSVNAGITCPAWLHDVYGVPLITVTAPKSGQMPPPWNATFLTKWRNFVRAYAEHVDSHESLAYVAEGGLGQVNESYMVGSPDYTVWKAQATADGYPTVGDAWIDAATKITQIHMDYFLETPVVATIALPVPNAVPAGEINGGQTLLQWYQPMKDLYGTRFGFMNSGLNPDSNADGSFVPNIIIKEQSPFGPAGFQFAHASSTSADYSDVMDAGLAMLMKYIEIYLPNANTTDAAYTAITISTRAAMAAITP